MRKAGLMALMTMLIFSMCLIFQSAAYSAGAASLINVTKVELNTSGKCSVCEKDRINCTCVPKDVHIDCGISNHTLELRTSGEQSSTPDHTVLVLDGLKNNDIRNVKAVELEFSTLNSIEICGQRLNVKPNVNQTGFPVYVKVIPNVVEGSSGDKTVVITLNKVIATTWWDKLFFRNKNSVLSKIRYSLNVGEGTKTPSNNKFVVYSKHKTGPFDDAVVLKQRLEAEGRTSTTTSIKVYFTSNDINGRTIDPNLMAVLCHGSYDGGGFSDLEVPKTSPMIYGARNIPISKGVINNSKVNWLIISACRTFHPLAESHVLEYISKSKNLKGIFGYGQKITESEELSTSLASRHNESMLRAWFLSNAQIWFDNFNAGVKKSDNAFYSASAVFSVNNLDDPMFGDISPRCQQFAVVKFKESNGQIVHTTNTDGTLRSVTLVITIGNTHYEREVLSQ